MRAVVFREFYMHHAHQTQFGRPEAAALPDHNDTGMIDKWDILEALTEAADTYGLNHRTLSVLKALMTFLPGRLIPIAPLGAIVFPSNRTLSKRLSNMPDSTLRRHLATLVAAGIVSRHNSANRKRFARRVGTEREIAFGLDLSPLARKSADIMHHADTAARIRERLCALRVRFAQMRQTLLTETGSSPLLEEAGRLLRRKPEEAPLHAMFQQLQGQLDELEADKMNITDAQNERHIQNDFITISDSEDFEQDNSISREDAQTRAPAKHRKPKRINLADVTRICQSYKSFFPNPISQWHELAQVADRLTPMIGINPLMFKDAMKRMGLPAAVTAVLCILERLNEIGNPGGYLRRLIQSARAGVFDAHLLLNSIANTRKLSADNLIVV